MGSARHADGVELDPAQLRWFVDELSVDESGPLAALPPLSQGRHVIALRHPEVAGLSARVLVVVERAEPANLALVERCLSDSDGADTFVSQP